jgi:hypothetical protein
MSDEPEAPMVSAKLRNVFVAVNGLAVAISLLASFVDLIIGTRNPGLFVVPVVQLFLTAIALHVTEVAEDNPAPWAFWLGKQQRADFERRRMKCLLLFLAAFFLLTSLAILCVAIHGGPF